MIRRLARVMTTTGDVGTAFGRPGAVCGRALLVVAALTSACGGSSSKDAPKLKELQRATAGGMTGVPLASGAALKWGRDTAYLEFRSGSDQRLADVGAVKVSATMTMAGMPPM